jgi:hypothetical protein
MDRVVSSSRMIFLFLWTRRKSLYYNNRLFYLIVLDKNQITPPDALEIIRLSGKGGSYEAYILVYICGD